MAGWDTIDDHDVSGVGFKLERRESDRHGERKWTLVVDPEDLDTTWGHDDALEIDLSDEEGGYLLKYAEADP